MNIEKAAVHMEQELGLKRVFTNEHMSRHTSFKVGGPADILVVPETTDEIRKVLSYTADNNYPLYIMGNGTNLIVKDKGIRGVVLKILDNFNSIKVENDIIEAEAGTLLSKLSNLAADEGLTGLEFACGIPGTLGGALVMNAGAYDGQMSDVVDSTEYINMDGEIRTLSKNDHGFGYRTSFFSRGGYIVLKCSLRLTSGIKEDIYEKMRTLRAQRLEKQPLSFPSAGSIFKRPQGYFTGKLIEDAGLKGYSFGGAQVSEKHTGFIINKGGATAGDILGLIQIVKDRVKLRFGVELETEVRIIGED